MAVVAEKGKEERRTGQVRLPSAAVLANLGEEDVALLRRFVSEEHDCVFDPEFRRADAAARIFGVAPKLVGRTTTRFPLDGALAGDPESIGDRVPALSAERERNLFLRYNYARHQVSKICEEYAGRRLSAGAARLLVAWGRRMLDIRGAVVRLNVPLVLAMAKRTRLNGIDFNELVSEGNLALLRSVEKFDCARGFKFSTYACRAILKSFSRVAMRVSRYQGQFPVEFDPSMERSDFIDRKRLTVELDCVEELKQILVNNYAGLSDVERTVIIERFALVSGDDAHAPKTLEQVGSIIGVTKERVRQIQNKALRKIRTALEENYLAA
jgi:RNA polymerase sigma factor (sigma-70 family)